MWPNLGQVGIFPDLVVVNLGCFRSFSRQTCDKWVLRGLSALGYMSTSMSPRQIPFENDLALTINGGTLSCTLHLHAMQTAQMQRTDIKGPFYILRYKL